MPLQQYAHLKVEDEANLLVLFLSAAGPTWHRTCASSDMLETVMHCGGVGVSTGSNRASRVSICMNLRFIRALGSHHKVLQPEHESKCDPV